MGDATLKPSSGDDLVLSNDDGSAKLELNEDQTVKITTGSVVDAVNFDSNTLSIDASNNRIGIGTASPGALLSVNGSEDNGILEVLRLANSDWASGETGQGVKLSFQTGNNAGTLSFLSQIISGKDSSYNDSSTRSGNLQFVVNNANTLTEAMRIASSGNVGIGTSSSGTYPNELLHVKNATGNARLKIESDQASSEAVLKLDVNATSSFGSILFQEADTDKAAIIYRTTEEDLNFRTGGAGVSNTRMIINSSGDINCASAPLNIDGSGNTQKGFGVSGSAGTGHFATDKGTTGILVQSLGTFGSGTHNLLFFLNQGTNVGEITTDGSSTNYSETSDYRLKENVIPLTGAINRLNQLKPSRFNFITNPDKTVDGFLAHEVSDYVPEAITGEKDAMITEEFIETEAVFDDEGNEITPAIMGTREVIKPQGIDQSKIVPLLVASVQELSAKVTALENA
tara:strand:- start:3072 stop:4439 length:1368 start_codon:yes stop_codon:yes gene_type:complete